MLRTARKRPITSSNAPLGLRLLLCLLLWLPFAQASDLALEARLLALTNEARLEAGLKPLEPDETLARSARAHAAEMAELQYFSHDSPRPKNATLARRAANAGSFARDLGENLALVGDDDPAEASVQGWLGSPGHRANLLRREFSHVGFGTARYPDGRIVIAQEFALEPALLENASLEPVAGARPQLDILLELSESLDVAVFFANTASQPVTLAAGRQLLHIPLSGAPARPLELQLGLRDPGSGAAFTLQAGGTLGVSGYRAEPGATSQLLNAALVSPLATAYDVQLVFSDAPRLELSAWQNDVLIPASLSGRTLTLRLANSAYPLHLGALQTDGRYRVLFSFIPGLGAAPRLLPVTE